MWIPFIEIMVSLVLAAGQIFPTQSLEYSGWLGLTPSELLFGLTPGLGPVVITKFIPQHIAARYVSHSYCKRNSTIGTEVRRSTGKKEKTRFDLKMKFSVFGGVIWGCLALFGTVSSKNSDKLAFATKYILCVKLCIECKILNCIQNFTLWVFKLHLECRTTQWVHMRWMSNYTVKNHWIFLGCKNDTIALMTYIAHPLIEDPEILPFTMVSSSYGQVPTSSSFQLRVG